MKKNKGIVGNGLSEIPVVRAQHAQMCRSLCGYVRGSPEQEPVIFGGKLRHHPGILFEPFIIGGIPVDEKVSVARILLFRLLKDLPGSLLGFFAEFLVK